MNIDRTTVALVTGAAGGIGAATTARLRNAGATVIAADLAGADVGLDVTDLAKARATVDGIVAAHGRLDLLVACAGIGIAGLVEELDDTAWDRSIAVNLTGTINTVRAAYDVMRPASRGQLVAVASLSGLLPTPLLTSYATTKGGVVSFMTSLRPEAARHGIGATAICPGPVDTGLLDVGGAGGIDVRRYLTNAAGPAIAPTAVADAIMAGIRRNRAIVVPKRARVLHLAARLSPGTTERVLTHFMKRELAHRA